MAEDPPVKLEIPIFAHEPQQHLRALQWCDGHWTELVTSLHARGLEHLISRDADELTQKFLKDELDPCWEATNMINMGALECFGVQRVIEENAGCPVCSFANIIQHIADLMAQKHGVVQ